MGIAAMSILVFTLAQAVAPQDGSRVHERQLA